MLRRSSRPKILERSYEFPAEDASIGVVEPARLDSIKGDRYEVIEVEPLSLGHAAVLLAEVEVGHRRIIGVECGEQSSFTHGPEGMLAQAREPIGDDHVAVGADGQWDTVGGHASDQRRILHDRDPVVDALQAENVQADQDVLGSHAQLRRVHAHPDDPLGAALAPQFAQPLDELPSCGGCSSTFGMAS